MAKCFVAADVAMLPYRKLFNGTSGVLQHADAADKPVIASDVGKVGPIVREEGLGIGVESEPLKFLAKGIREFLARNDELSGYVRAQALRYAEADD